MSNSLFQSEKLFTVGLYKDNCKVIGGASKGNKIVSNQKSFDNAESQMMNIAYKVGRSEAQREERKSQRK